MIVDTVGPHCNAILSNSYSINNSGLGTKNYRNTETTIFRIYPETFEKEENYVICLEIIFTWSLNRKVVMKSRTMKLAEFQKWDENLGSSHHVIHVAVILYETQTWGSFSD